MDLDTMVDGLTTEEQRMLLKLVDRIDRSREEENRREIANRREITISRLKTLHRATLELASQIKFFLEMT